MTDLDIGGGFYQSDSLPISAQEAVNVYLSRPQTASPTTKNLFTTPGITLAAMAGVEKNRGSHAFLDIPYFVNGDGLYRLGIVAGPNPTYFTTNVSGAVLIEGEGRVIMADNGKEGGELCIVAPDFNNQFNMWIYDGSTLVQVSDSDFAGPVSSVRYIDGYFEFTKLDDQTFFISNLRDGLVYTATDVGTAEADPDSIVSSFVLHNELIILGSKTFEPFQNVGGSGFPFQRVEGGVQKKGLSSKFAIEEVNDNMIFLGAGENETPSILISNGGKPERLSTIAIDNAIAKYSDDTITSCFSFSYSQSGAQFVGFTFPNEKTFIFDFTSKEWHTRESLNTTYRVCSIVKGFGKFFVGDCLNGNIGLLDKEINDEYGVEVHRRFVTPHLDNEGEPFFIDALELWGESGIGLTNGGDPEVLMSMSTDGGRTYSDPLATGMGATGEYDTRTIWNQLGRVGRQVCFKFEVTAAVKWVFSKVEARF